jgi:glycosyltransferase involved in cell wall biosynthesis
MGLCRARSEAAAKGKIAAEAPERKNVVCSMQNTQRASCIIPFYNEGTRIFPVLEAVTKVRGLDEIICVDDGSTDNTTALIQARWPQVRLLRLSRNGGKTAAIRYGLCHSSGELILLMDADLQHLKQEEIDFALRAFRQRPSVDMIVMRRTNAPWSVKIDRGDILFSGERIMKKQDLASVLNLPVEGYQLEVAINQYMQEHRKKVRWVPWSAVNTFKVKKCGLLDGLRKDLFMYADIISYLGLANFLLQIITFGRKPFGTSKKHPLHRREYPIGAPARQYSKGNSWWI